jgi:hypothetical protein
VLSQAFHLVGIGGSPSLRALLERGALAVTFDLAGSLDSVLRLLVRYGDRPASLADACLVRMTELLARPMLLTTDDDFTVYRRHGRQVIPCSAP